MNAPDTWHFDRQLRHQLKRDMLLKVAAQCFNDKGTSGTSLKDVARQLGITDAAVYYYVKNKEELIYLCYSRALDIGGAALDRAIGEGQTSLERLQLYIRYQIEAVCGEEGPVAMLSEIPSLSKGHKDELLKRSRDHTRRITALIEGGIAAGEMQADNAAMVSNAILGAVNWVPKWFKPSASNSGEEVAKVFANSLTLGLRA
ncbi:MAG TPA: TetR/AcrR family transcriptional regulator [Hyphomonas sp.]|nr:TetR/AcrR family transcriptional regulator [Hyphomonas sp.]